MHPSFQKLIDAKAPMELKPPASPKAIAQFERAQGIELPEHYWEFLQFGNGGHFFGHNFYGIDPENENYYLAKENASKPYSIPADWYIVGATGYGDLYCIDPATNEVVQWDHERREASLRWADMFELVEDELQSYEENRVYDEEKDKDDEVYVWSDSGIVDLFHTDEMMFVTFDKGPCAGQMIYYFGWMENGAFKFSTGTAKQVVPISRDAIPDDDDLEFIRKIPPHERASLYKALEAFSEKNPDILGFF